MSLLARSTRRLSLTDAGERFYQRSLQLLQEAENVLDDVRRDHHGLSGVLRITSTPEYGALVVAPALAAFSRQHPRLRIQHVSSSYHADLISERFDVAIRPPAGGFQPPRGTDRLFRHFSGGGAGLPPSDRFIR